jgi:formate dehydrogenase major subunit
MKLMRAVFGTNSVDHCARLCHASTVAGLAATLGSGAMTNSNAEVLESDVILVTGSNTTETHPVIGSFMKQAKEKGAKIIVIDPRRIELADYADVFLQIAPGTNVAIFNALMNVIIEENLQDQDYIKERTENYEGLVEMIKGCTPELAASVCGVDVEDIKKAARLYAGGKKAAIYYAMGVTQHSTGTQGVKDLAALAMLCGNIGIESGGVNPLRGQNNVQGACDLGALPNVLTGYQKVTDQLVIDKFNKAWDTDLPKDIGLTVTEIIHSAGIGEVRFLYIMGENPMLSEPDLNHVWAAMKKTEFLVVQDIFLTETAEIADVVLPATCFAEKDGTFTNTERRIQRVRKAVDAPGQAISDWEIIMKIMNGMGYKKTYHHPSEIMEEIAALTPIYAGISYHRISGEGLQWPCLDKHHNGTKYLHKEHFNRGLGLFDPAPYQHADEMTDPEYPIILTTGRILYHWHTRTMTKRVEAIHAMYPSSFIEINPITARELEVMDGDQVKVTSRRGEVLTTVKVTDTAQEGVVFMPFHFDDGPANILTNVALDPIAKIPELKVAAVKIEACPRTRMDRNE